jgi:hypothetical protein
MHGRRVVLPEVGVRVQQWYGCGAGGSGSGRGRQEAFPSRRGGPGASVVGGWDGAWWQAAGAGDGCVASSRWGIWMSGSSSMPASALLLDSVQAAKPAAVDLSTGSVKDPPTQGCICYSVHDHCQCMDLSTARGASCYWCNVHNAAMMATILVLHSSRRAALPPSALCSSYPYAVRA